MQEANIVAGIMKYLKSLEGCFAWKEHGGMYGTAGIPDIICCFKGRFIGIEVKRPGGKPTKLQEVTLMQIGEAGGVAVVANSVEDVAGIIKGL